MTWVNEFVQSELDQLNSLSIVFIWKYQTIGPKWMHLDP